MSSRGGYVAWVFLATSLLIALINLSERYSWTFDMSDGARFTLPSELVEPLSSLSDPIIVKAYLPISAPPPYREIARHSRDLLSSLTRAQQQISLTVIDSAQEQSEIQLLELSEVAEQDGVRTAQLSVERGGRRVLLEVPYGVSFSRFNQRVVTPPVERLEEIEYQIARATKRLLELRPPQRIGLSQGSGEPDLFNSPLAKRLEAEGTLVPVRLDGETLEDEIDVLVLLGATKSYGEHARWVIDRLLCDGGSVIMALDHRQQSELFTEVWSPRPTGVEPLLRRYGVSTLGQWVIADKKHPAPAPLSRDARGQITFASHPLYPLGIAQEHPITAALSEVVVPMAPLFELPPKAVPLVLSSLESTALRSLKSLNVEEAEEEKQAISGFPLAFAIEFRPGECLERPSDHQNFGRQIEVNGRPFDPLREEASQPARLVVIGSGRRLLSADPKGLELLMNAIAWGRRDGSLLSLKKRRVQKPRLSLSAEEQRMIQWGSILLPIVLIVLITTAVKRPRRWRVRERTSQEARHD